MSAAQTAIVIPMHNALRQLPRCLDSLGWAHDEAVVIVVVDAGSTDGGTEWIATHFPEVVIVDGDAGMWWTEATEVGCRFAVGELKVEQVGLLNVDCAWNQRGFVAARAALERYPGVIVCSHVQDRDGGATTFAGGVTRRSGVLTLRGAGAPGGTAPSAWVAWCGGQGVLFDSRVFVDTGGFDYRAFPHYFGDSDFCFRAAYHGTRVWYCSDSTVTDDKITTGISAHQNGGSLLVIWQSLSSRRSVFNLRDNVRFYARHARWRAPIVLLNLYLLWAAWSARGFIRGRLGV